MSNNRSPSKARIETVTRKEKPWCSKTVALEIERIYGEGEGDLTYVDAVVEFCENNEIEVEDVIRVLHKNIVEKIKEESIALNIIKGNKKKKLPF